MAGLIAGERHNDRGLDAYAPASASADRKGKGLACSTTSTLDKVKKDAKKVKENYPDVSTRVFYTTEKITQSEKAKWAEAVRQKFGYELIVASREEIIASLRLPRNAQLCRTHLDIPVPYEPAIKDLLAQAREAAAAVAAEWAAHPRLAGKPQIVLNAVRCAPPKNDFRKPLPRIEHIRAFSARRFHLGFHKLKLGPVSSSRDRFWLCSFFEKSK